MNQPLSPEWLGVRNTHGEYLLSLKDHVTFVTVDEKFRGGRPVGSRALVVGVRRKIPIDQLRPVKEYWDHYNKWQLNYPVPAYAHLTMIPPMILGVPTDIIETQRIVHMDLI